MVVYFASCLTIDSAIGGTHWQFFVQQRIVYLRGCSYDQTALVLIIICAQTSIHSDLEPDLIIFGKKYGTDVQCWTLSICLDLSELLLHSLEKEITVKKLNTIVCNYVCQIRIW